MTATTDVAPPRALDHQTGMRLRDGRRVRLRRLHPDDVEAVVRLFATANPLDLRRRFLGQPPPIGRLARRICSGDGVHHLALGAFDGTGRVVAVAQFDRRDDSPTADFAIEVASEWQQDHLGTVMLRRIATLARLVGVEHFTAVFLAENVAIQKLLRHTGTASTTTYADGEGFLTVDLAGL